MGLTAIFTHINKSILYDYVGAIFKLLFFKWGGSFQGQKTEETLSQNTRRRKNKPDDLVQSDVATHGQGKDSWRRKIRVFVQMSQGCQSLLVLKLKFCFSGRLRASLTSPRLVINLTTVLHKQKFSGWINYGRVKKNSKERERENISVRIALFNWLP